MEASLTTLEITIDHARLGATILAPAIRMPGLLFVHGWGGSQLQAMERARRAVGLSCICLTFDLRGHERHAGLRNTVTRGDNMIDVLAAYDTLARSPNVDVNAIGVIGYSYGAYLSTLLTAERDVQWLALRAPAIYPDQPWEAAKVALNHDPALDDYRNRKLTPNENRALSACARFRGDALVVEAELDRIVPAQTHRNFEAAFSQARSLHTHRIAGAGHALETAAQQTEYTAVLIGWLERLIRGQREHLANQAVDARRNAIPD